ncbi:MAG: Ribosomal RNA small subunit methyltransferase D [Planctomycetes bacterium ADurb.Bin126]|nr:MAG: Ribosomal RNA small subunit methyltransferase D [Planctomycetes bacterium ADurb.Bin126]HOD82547.1 16S rRNA (guanine(966)-N(2))-methyltransferase RsmD [Phycisphaerae bacterium]HQL74954.1 16S rRNA (guanine(966)-N(2))-methyltransferase RsmD [Phycisphaerae bacterium]
MHILAGEFKGRALLSPPAHSQTRPVTGLVKKSLFDMLMPVLEGARAVDLYCGTGTMGLEALSRGAAFCAFAERDRGVVDRLRRNIQACRVDDRSRVWSGDLHRRLRHWLGELDAPLDLAFVDPPYAESRQWDWRQAAERVFQPVADHLADEGLLVLRLGDRALPPEELAGLSPLRVRHYGKMTVALLGKASQGHFRDPCNTHRESTD